MATRNVVEMDSELAQRLKARLKPVKEIVVVLECAAGNAEVGSMWLETRIFSPDHTLEDVLDWKEKMSGSHGKLIITVANN